MYIRYSTSLQMYLNYTEYISEIFMAVYFHYSQVRLFLISMPDNLIITLASYMN